MFYNHFEKTEKGSLVASDCLVLYYLFSISFVDSNLRARDEEVYAMMPGEVVAISGNTGRSTAPHLHITVKYGKKHIDPVILLQLVKETREEALAHLVAGN